MEHITGPNTTLILLAGLAILISGGIAGAMLHNYANLKMDPRHAWKPISFPPSFYIHAVICLIASFYLFFIA